MFAWPLKELIGLSWNKKSIKRQKENIIKDYFRDSKAVSFWKEWEKDTALIYAVRDISLVVACIISYPIEKILNVTKSTLVKVDEILISKLEENWDSKRKS